MILRIAVALATVALILTGCTAEDAPDAAASAPTAATTVAGTQPTAAAATATATSATVAGPMLDSIESTLIPPGYDPTGEPLPPMLLLHGGGDSRDFLVRWQERLEQLWASDALPPMVVATLSAGRSIYMDYVDGSQCRQSFISGPFIDHLTARFNVSEDGIALFGLSMGGAGALRLAFNEPERFCVVVAMEPALDTLTDFSELRSRDRWWRGDALVESVYGGPGDEDYWSRTHPTSLVLVNDVAIRDFGMAIFIEVGDEDFFNLHEGTEILHRVLWDHDILHQYYLIWGANHGGNTLEPRYDVALAFLDGALRPDTSPDAGVVRLEGSLGAAKRQAEATSPDPWVGEFAP
ncbi:MAG TPA: alpha/beta hydrolase-fold protein [Dehalococcoidia bacterium]|nr:alpha/beta hydrolase-fold protein [Dehalococcoidia bacterium]